MKKDFLLQYGHGYHTFNVPLSERPERYLVGLMADQVPATLDSEEMENKYSLRTHFLNNNDFVIVYCDKGKYVIFTMDFSDFEVVKRRGRQCYMCNSQASFELTGVEVRTDNEDGSGICEYCLNSLWENIDNSFLKASVLSQNI